ncbi:MAG: hypothetical protein JNK82_35495 [Myxococcaceae bacterium]|nr:hypothetical protein [Myxococcaceae bacterium]
MPTALRAQQGIRGPHRSHHAASVEPNAKTHPRLFTEDGQRKWKVPPHGAKVEQNTAGNGSWIERWPAPAKPGTATKWVYNYTLEEVQRRAGIKFAENRELAKHLPQIRARVREDLGATGKAREVAMVMTLIDKLCLRVGGQESADARDHFGATTLEKQHVRVDGDTVRLKFTGKSGVPWNVSLKDARLAAEMKRQVGPLRNKESPVFKVSADDVNRFLAPFGATAKKFRTFHATRIAREELLQHAKAPLSKRAQIVTDMFEKVAEQLGHTPAVARSSYVDPMVVAAFMKGRLA